MLTKVGRTHPMLICTDCGQPVDQLASSSLARKRIRGALSLLGLAAVGCGVFLLASMEEWRTASTPEPEEAAPRDQAEPGARPPGLLEPSRLVRPGAEPVAARARESMGSRGTRWTFQASAEARAPAAQEKKQQQHPSEQKP